MEILLGIAIGLELFLIFLISKKDYINQMHECNFQELELEQKQEQEFIYQEFEQEQARVQAQEQEQEYYYQELEKQEYQQSKFQIVNYESLSIDTMSIEGTPKTPTVYFSGSQGIFDIKGRSIPENSIEFYRVVEDYLEAYTLKIQPQTTVNIKLEYFNTSSSKCLLGVFKKIETIHNVNQGVTINWFYDKEDEDMLEAGQDYESIIRVPFQMIEE